MVVMIGTIHELWEVVSGRTCRTAEELGLYSFSKLRSWELSRLDELIHVKIPKLGGELHENLTWAAKE